MVSNKKIFWTAHSKIKMRQYGLSAGKLLQIVRNPERKEKGIAPGCTALMQTRKVFTSARTLSKRKTPLSQTGVPAKPATLASRPPGEIWLMYKDIKDIRNIISAWRYPGVSKPGESIPIPEDIRQELLKNV